MEERTVLYKVRPKRRRERRMRNSSSTGIFDSVFGSSLNHMEIPKWVKESLSRKIWRNKKLVIVSAVCPDYERKDGYFTYRNMGSGLPFTASKHLLVVQAIAQSLATHDIEFEYHVTLADTEFDLPLVVKNLAGGSINHFLSLCEQSTVAIKDEATSLNILIGTSAQFTTVFPEWFPTYEQALVVTKKEVEEDQSVRSDLFSLMERRMPLYRAMAGLGPPDMEYCREMVLRQWAQYMAWGECASQVFGDSVVMMNHTTPNLSRVNHPFSVRAGSGFLFFSYPSLQCPSSTTPSCCFYGAWGCYN